MAAAERSEPPSLDRHGLLRQVLSALRLRPTRTDPHGKAATLPRIADPLLRLVALLAVALPLVPADIRNPRWHGLKTLIFEVGAAVVLGLWPISRARFQTGGLGRGAPMVLAVLILWAWLSHSLTSASAPDHAFSFLGWWLLAGGLVVMGVVATGIRQREALTFLLDALNVAAIVIGGGAIALYLKAGVPVAEGNYHDHMLLGAALAVLLPMTLAAAAAPLSQGRKTLALVALVVCASGLMLAQTRSSWIGAAVALAVFGALWLWCRPRGPNRREEDGPSGGRGQALVYVILVAVALGGFLLYAQQNGLLAARAHTLTTSVLTGREASVEWRLSTWRGAVRMVEPRPLLGWGVGCYPLRQQPFTGTGEPPTTVAANGPRIWDEAHDSYLQIAAELGLPGLILWLSVLGAAFAGGLTALRRLPEGGLRQRALIGAVSALAAQAVDALANPGWQFGEVAVYLWIVLGMIAGLTGGAQGGAEESKVGGADGPPWIRPLRVAAALAVCAWVVYEAVTNALLLPTPHL